jgi:hypothetical protein
MKTQSYSGALLCAFFFAMKMSIFGQGSIFPTTAPTLPIMKTLDQVEARTPLAGGTLPLGVGSGSYYLTGDLNISGTTVNGITVSGSNVTIDLNGFSLNGPGTGSGSAIYLSGGVSNVTILNGTIRNWGSHGINALGNPILRAQKLRLISNGGDGIAADANAELVDCIADNNVSHGIFGKDNCRIKDCQVTGTTGSPGNGITLGAAAVVTESIARGNNGDGIAPDEGSTVRDCAAFSNTQNGILVGDGCTVKDCTARTNSSNGIKAGNDCELTQNHCSNNGVSGTDAGIWVTGSRTVIDANRVSNNHSTGIRVTNTNNVMFRNVAVGQLFDYTAGGGGDIAPGGTVATSTNPWLNILD